jgi:hypothetical protein
MANALALLIHLPLLFILAIFLKKKFKDHPLIPFFWPALIIKLIAGILISLLFKYYYRGEGDIFLIQLFTDILCQQFFDDPIEYFKIVFLNEIPKSEITRSIYKLPRTVAFSKLTSLLSLLNLGNYWITSLHLSLFSFLGSWVIANNLIKFYKTHFIATGFSFLFLPSFVLWTSGIIKETFVIGSICFIISITLKYIHLRKFNIYQLPFILFITYFSWQIKFYYFLILLPVLISYTMICLSNKTPLLKKDINQVCAFFFGIALIAILAITVHPSLSLEYLLNALYESYIHLHQLATEQGKIAFEFKNFKPELSSILQNAPQALVIGLFRPFIWECPFNFTFLVGIEGLFILILATGKIIQLIKTPGKISIETIAILTYVFLTAIMMSLISPNWGTLIRYKSAFLPFWFLFLCVNNPTYLYVENSLVKILHLTKTN